MSFTAKHAEERKIEKLQMEDKQRMKLKELLKEKEKQSNKERLLTTILMRFRFLKKNIAPNLSQIY
jgi:hypothetical protein